MKYFKTTTKTQAVCMCMWEREGGQGGREGGSSILVCASVTTQTQDSLIISKGIEGPTKWPPLVCLVHDRLRSHSGVVVAPRPARVSGGGM